VKRIVAALKKIASQRRGMAACVQQFASAVEQMTSESKYIGSAPK
jgi:hypothetical protein